MIAIATVSTPIPLDRLDTMLPSPFAEASDDAAFRPSPAAPSHRIFPRIIERSMAVKTTDSMIGDRVCLPSLAARALSQASYLVKVPLIDRSHLGEQALLRTPETAAEIPTRPICHLWLTVTSILDDLIYCSVVEAPDALHLKRGDSFVVASESIEDWMINIGGTAFGGFTLRVIRSRLGKAGQMKFDAHTGIRDFKKLVP
jgi:hypothetical protein